MDWKTWSVVRVASKGLNLSNINHSAPTVCCLLKKGNVIVFRMTAVVKEGNDILCRGCGSWLRHYYSRKDDWSSIMLDIRPSISSKLKGLIKYSVTLNFIRCSISRMRW